MAAVLEENGCSRQSSCSAGDSDGEKEDSPYLRARLWLENLLNKNMRIRMTDGRTLVGCFLCTDRDCNVILGSAQEYLKPSDTFSAGEPRVLGLAMVPGHHIVSIEVELESLTFATVLVRTLNFEKTPGAEDFLLRSTWCQHYLRT